MAASRLATRVVRPAVQGSRSMSTSFGPVRDLGGAVNGINGVKSSVKQNMAFYQAPGVGTITEFPTFLKGPQDGMLVPVIGGFVGLVCVPLTLG
eukprot:CAMPEP_0116839204 /NCGR_PEP_ID=MMETSP0418-20121206/9637_1 /TAXON_ID=1158023 /ORGANISM="Astrosyne radiata, Strain 13vi08-1A" /LENGTH=93 /DNA_ID=CAMNT_0004469289 /DNA_START=13 /DNA_END=291 /DNA_ORIENTATION=-